MSYKDFLYIDEDMFIDLRDMNSASINVDNGIAIRFDNGRILNTKPLMNAYTTLKNLLNAFVKYQNQGMDIKNESLDSMSQQVKDKFIKAVEEHRESCKDPNCFVNKKGH